MRGSWRCFAMAPFRGPRNYRRKDEQEPASAKGKSCARTPEVRAMNYWIETAKSAFSKSLLFFFDDPRKALFIFALGAVVTTLIVWWFRSKEAFTEHWKSNIAIPIAGGICTWLPIFAYYLLIGPGQDIEKISLLLATSQLNERSAIIAREGAEAREGELNRLKNSPLIVHGACKVPEEELNPSRAQRSCPTMPGAPPPSFRDRVLAINSRLTESDRNRFSDALAEFEKSLTDGRSLFYKINTEGGMSWLSVKWRSRRSPLV